MNYTHNNFRAAYSVFRFDNFQFYTESCMLHAWHIGLKEIGGLQSTGTKLTEMEK